MACITTRMNNINNMNNRETYPLFGNPGNLYNNNILLKGQSALSRITEEGRLYYNSQTGEIIEDKNNNVEYYSPKPIKPF